MKYNYAVIYNGKFYRAGEEVPVVTDEKASENNGEGTEEEEVDSEDAVPEPKKAYKRKTKA